MKTLVDLVRLHPGDFATQAKVVRAEIAALRVDLSRMEGALLAIEAQIRADEAPKPTAESRPA